MTWICAHPGCDRPPTEAEHMATVHVTRTGHRMLDYPRGDRSQPPTLEMIADPGDRLVQIRTPIR